MGLKGIHEPLLRLIALYGDPGQMVQILKATREVQLPDLPPDRQVEPYGPHPNDHRDVAIRSDGIVDWIRSIPEAIVLAADAKSRERVAASENVTIFRRMLATFRARTLIQD